MNASGRFVQRSFVATFVRHYLRYDPDNPFIFVSTLLAFLGITTGVMVLIVAMAIMNGTYTQFKEKLFVMNYPLTVTSFGPGVARETVETIAEAFPELKLSPYYTTQVIAKRGESIQGSIVFGVDFERERALNPVLARALGDRPMSATPFHAVIGDGLGVLLDVHIGDKLLLYFSEQQAVGFGSIPLQKRFVVDAVFDSGLAAYDKAIIYTTQTALRKLLKRPEGFFDGIHIYSNDPMRDIDRIRAILPEDDDIQGWWQQNGSFYAAMELDKKALFLVLLLIILVASLNIISSLLMTVMSRRSEIALMRTLGASARQIRTIFFRLGLIIGGAGIVTGSVLGWIGIWVLKTFDLITLPPDVYGDTRLPVDLLWSDFGLIILGAAVIVLLSSLYPARKAAATDPLHVLRNE
jgi:putative ABC transport system permease protein